MRFEDIFVTCAIVSSSLSTLVVLTGIVFPRLMLGRNHPFSNIIFFISLSDLGASIANCFGYPEDGQSALCQAQSFMIAFFFPASWAWIAALVYQLRCMLLFKRLYLSVETLHVICWSVGVLTSILPLSQNEMGEDDEESGDGVCIYRNTDSEETKFLWVLFLFYGVFFILLLAMTTWLVSVFLGRGQLDSREKMLYYTMGLYPIGLLICWFLPFLTTVRLAVGNYVTVDEFKTGELTTTLYGSVLAIIFFWNSKIARQHWVLLFLRCMPCTGSSSANNSVASSVDYRSDLSGEVLDPHGQLQDDTSRLTRLFKDWQQQQQQQPE
mmetsp:Transcript_4004/g.6297  ORF Transcript_4004/g.6297 Transcript_4004/m.6297 type:complete len:325 (-) Transcript_4004:482-1456(-)